MGYLFLIAPIALQVTCVIHAVKTSRVFPWIYVIVFLPLVGCIAYIAVELVPEWTGGYGAQKLKSNVTAFADPNRSMRQALHEAELSGSVDARRALAEEYIARGGFAEALAIYQGLLTGHFREDPVLWFGLARAQFLSGDGAAAQASLDELQRVDPKFQSGDAHLLYARALEAQGKDLEARDEYARLLTYAVGEEARCRYALLLDRIGDTGRAREIYAQVIKSIERAPIYYRKQQKEWYRVAKEKLAGS